MKSDLPYNVMRHRDWEVAPRDPVTIGTLILGKVGAAAAGTFITAAVGYLATTVITSWALQALAPKPKSGGAQTQGLLTNLREAAAPREYVYGEVRKGGVITYLEATGTNNKFLHMIISLAGHELQSIDDIYINDEIVALDGNGFVTSSPWNSKIRIQKFLGNQTTAPASLLAESTQVDANFIGRGIAYLYIRMEYDQDVFANGIPLFTAKVKGKKVFDPRTSTTAYSANAALCIRDYLVTDYGMADVGATDDTVFSVAANVCGEVVPKAGGGTEPRYEMNGVISAALAPGDILQSMMTSCAGTLFWGQGKWQLKPGYYSAPAKTFTLDDLRGPISLSTRTSRRDNFNIVRGKFNNAAARWITSDYPELRSAAFIAEDGGLENALDIEFPLTTSAAMVQRLAKLTLFRGREQMAFSADFSMAAFNVQVGDIIALTNPRYGWVAKDFEVIGWRFFADGDAGDLRVNLSLRETSAAAFAWDAEESAIISNNTILPNPRFAATPSLSLLQELQIINENVVGVLLVNVVSNADFLVSSVEVQVRGPGETNYRQVGSGPVGRYEVQLTQEGLYDVRARTKNVLGVYGQYATIENYSFAPFQLPPAQVQNFSSNVVGGTILFSWTPVPDLDLSHYRIRYSSATTGASFSNSVDLVRKIARPGNSASAPAQTGTYFIQAVDKLGNVSVPSSTVVFVDMSQIQNLNVVEVLTQDPSFSGVREGVVVGEAANLPALILDTSATFDEAEGDFDDALGEFDAGFGTILPTGIYYFDAPIDLGEKYTSRVVARLDAFRLDYTDTFDSVDGLFDDRAGDFDGEPELFGDTTVRTQISFTDDDPSLTPTWTDWQDFLVGDIAARAIRFRAILESTNTFATPAVTRLEAEIDMPDRVEAQSDLDVVGSKVVNFPVAFKATPSLGVAIANLTENQRYAITSKTRSGFTISIFDAGGGAATNSVNLDYVAKGFGRQMV
jgi:hypothetical protein